MEINIKEAFALEEGKTYWIECDKNVTGFDMDTFMYIFEKNNPNIKIILAPRGMRPVPVKSLEEILKEGDEKIKSLSNEIKVNTAESHFLKLSYDILHKIRKVKKEMYDEGKLAKYLVIWTASLDGVKLMNNIPRKSKINEILGLTVIETEKEEVLEVY